MESFNLYSLAQSGLTEAQLLAIRDAALVNVGSGKSVTSVNAPGLATTFQLTAHPWEILRAVNFALQNMNPDRYGMPIQNQTIGYNR